MNERIKKIRMDKGLTQEEFAKKLDVKRNTVATYEMGRSEPSSAVISLICNVFSVNKEWLINGIGEQYKNKTRSQEIGEFANKIMSENDNNFKKRFLLALSKLDERDWEALCKIMTELEKEG